MDERRQWPSHMAPPEQRSGELIEDEKLLMRAMRNINRIAPGKNIDGFARLYEQVTASYLLALDRLKSSPSEDS